eukprot:m.232710 g.232710  ORF g.232710 m.232710 type:complete len:53 (+) comp15237_c2_seq2:4573-4731(+)
MLALLQWSHLTFVTAFLFSFLCRSFAHARLLLTLSCIELGWTVNKQMLFEPL